MAEKSEGSPFAIPTTVVLIAAAAVTWYRFVRPLVSDRPNAHETTQQAIGDQTYKSRLWQDPFAAVAEGGGSDEGYSLRFDKQRGLSLDRVKSGPPTAADTVRTQIFEKLSVSDRSQPVLILPVMVGNGAYADEEEWRRRCRYAVVNALFAGGYSADDRLHLGSFTMRLPSDGQIAGRAPKKNESTLAVPYEWFSPRLNEDVGCNYSHVLVLWIDDDAFSKYPVTRMVELLNDVLPEEAVASLKSRGRQAGVALRIIGPDNSNSLTAMLYEDPLLLNKKLPLWADHDVDSRYWSGAWDISTTEAVLPTMTWYSARATESNQKLLPGAPAQCETDQFGGIERDWGAKAQPMAVKWDACARDATKPLQIRRTICTDLQLMRKIVPELKERGLDGSQRVALITEFDTAYGRLISEAFKQAAKDTWTDWELENHPEKLVIRNYLRGLDGLTGDGQSSGGQDGQASRASNAGEKKSADLASPGGRVADADEKPDGNRQYDYMRRIADKLKEAEDAPALHGENRFRAIGILGTDTYDKLLVLRALRDSFPNAIFFTTDLDNRLFQHSELPSTQNLIVASGYGLSLDGKIQQTVPEFRDGYQTAIFASCLEALGSNRDAFAKPLSPHIFEIGQNGPNELVTEKGNRAILPGFWKWDDLGWFLFAVAAMVMLSLFMLVPASRRLQRVIRPVSLSDSKPRGTGPWERWSSHIRMIRRLRGIEKIDDRRTMLVWVIFVFSAVVLLLTVLLDAMGYGKPNVFYSGINLWPTEFIRILAMLLSVTFTLWSHNALTYSDHELAYRYLLPTPPPQGSCALPAFEKGWFERMLTATIFDWRNRSSRYRHEEHLIPARLRKPRAGVSEVWSQYMERGTFRRRMARVLPLAFAFFFFAWLAQCFWGLPFQPYRGVITHGLDITLMVVSSLAVIVMTFFMVDATRLCEAFCNNLAGHLTPWGDAQAEAFAQTKAMNREDVEQWLDIEFIAERTAVIGRFIMYPFVVLAVMIIARVRVFDRWDWPIPLVVIFGINCAYAVWCVVLLRSSAERARTDAVEEMETRRLILAGEPTEINKARAEQLQLAIEAVTRIRKGAFAPLSKHPLVAAILIPASSAATVWIIEYLSNPH